MKYLCFCYYDTDKFARMTADEMQAVGTHCKPHDVALNATGKVVATASFSLPDAWKVVKPVAGTQATSSGPHVATAQQAGAVIVIEAADMDEALAIASKHATANYGEDLGFAIEVRECGKFIWGAASPQAPQL